MSEWLPVMEEDELADLSRKADKALARLNRRHSEWQPIETAPTDGTTIKGRYLKCYRFAGSGWQVRKTWFDNSDGCWRTARKGIWAPTQWKPE